MSCLKGMSSARVAENSPESGVCTVSWRQNSVHSQRYVQCPSGRTLSSFRGMSSIRLAELCPSSEGCQVSRGQISVLRQ
ncbi:hypothetical protein TNIN_31511 [Trichonephila inaurata madagascariensis]|uniref:Uncharacterized protein n=1 Tax=Trichonephila inaurata madagascariensis TaxID=2747483 RepID=A0A8X7BSU0_9ARAC|nr:hypothetical protein TNIN_31511 [Trichonephila inaurata madagascariensis]